jgi:hypothetical protein
LTEKLLQFSIKEEAALGAEVIACSSVTGLGLQRLRELGIWDVSEGLGGAFADVVEVLSRPCKFSDCCHVTEPGCVAKAAIKSGELSRERWEHYQNLNREAKFTEDKIRLPAREIYKKQIPCYVEQRE